jgi:hypothetical protein
MARKLVVEVVGETTGLSRSFRQASTEANRFQASIEHTFKNMGRNIAFGVGALVGAQGLYSAFTTTIKAAEGAAVAQKSLAAQMKTSSESFQQNKARVDAAEQSMAKYGFTSEDSARGLTTLDRATGSITKAFQLQGVAANVARARNISLSQAALILGKAYDGNTTSLKRLGVELPKGTKGMQAIYIVAQKFGGQAAANTTEFEKFGATLHNTEVIIGTALLPTVNRLLESLSKWLDNLNRSGQLQRDVNTAVNDAVSAFEAVKAIVVPLADAFQTLSKAVGGTKQAVELLIGAFAAFKAAKLLGGITSIAAGVGGIGAAARTSTGSVLALRAAMLGIPAAAYAVAKGGEAFSNWLGGTGFGKAVGAGNQNFPPGSLGYLANNAVQGGMGQGKFVEEAGLGGFSAGAARAAYRAAIRRNVYTVTGFGTVGGATAGLGGPRIGIPGASGTVYGPQTAYQRLQVAVAADPNNIGLLGQQAAHDRSAIAFAKTLQARGVLGGQKLTDTLTRYYNDLTSTLGQIQSIQDAAAAKTKAAADKAAAAQRRAEAEAKRRAAAAARVLAKNQQVSEAIAQDFLRGIKPGTLGVSLAPSFAEPLGLQLAEARAGALGQPLRPILIKMRAAARKALASGRLAVQAQIEAYNEITNINQQLKGAAKGFSNDIAQAKPYSLTRGGGVVINGGVHLHGIQDMQQLENQLEARAKARPKVRRGAR